MRNCFILGSGRSGTSMISGILYSAGYYMGENLYEGRDSNPKGFFENAEINGINEYILSQYDNHLKSRIKKWTKKPTIYAPSKGQRWLICIEKKVDFNDELIEEKILKATKGRVFAYKDPRFSYTLPIWERYVNDAFKIVMFREPEKTINSIIKECTTTKYLHNLCINENDAYKSWIANYSYILNNYDIFNRDKYLFIHYNQVLDGSCLPILEKKLNCQLTHDFVDNKLSRSIKSTVNNNKAKKIYEKLCSLAGYSNEDKA